MFGYIIINKGEMKFKDYDIYHAFYCGLCRTLKERYGRRGQMTLNYDMTFVVLLLSGLYEKECSTSVTNCIAHPFEKHRCMVNEFTEYAADMNILLSYYKCRDDWEDEKKKSRYLYAKALEKPVREIEKKYQKKAALIAERLEELSEREKENDMDIDRMSGLFGDIMAEIMVYREDEWKDELWNLGFYLGKYIYLLDAYEDVEEDIKKGNYNPFKEFCETEGFEENCRQILTMMIAECSKEFERLPILEYAEILRNILYSGVWYRYEISTQKRKEKREDMDRNDE